MASLTNTSSLGSILGIWAHPDDESFCSAGLMCMASRAGQPVACLTATKGEKGIQDPNRWPAEKLAEIRESEMKSALECIGMKTHHWLGYTDGELSSVQPQKAVLKLLEYIEIYKPDTIITFPPDGVTGHPDHRTVCMWTKLAVQQANRDIRVLYAVDSKEKYDGYTREADKKYNIYFNVDSPVVIPETECDIVLNLPADILDCKIRCLKSMPSQTESMFSGMGEDWVRGMLTTETFVLGHRTDISWNQASNRRS